MVCVECRLFLFIADYIPLYGPATFCMCITHRWNFFLSVIVGYFQFGDIMSKGMDISVNAVGHLCLWWKYVFTSIMNLCGDAGCYG